MKIEKTKTEIQKKEREGKKMKESYMTVEETAGYLSVSAITIYRLVKGKKIPAAKVGASWRFRKDILDHWMENQMSANQKVTSRRIEPVRIA